MKEFLIRVLKFLFPILLMMGFAEGYLRDIPNNYSHLHDLLLQRRDSMEVLILGNSHTYNGLDPDGFGVPTINAANPTQDVSIDRLLLEKHLEHSPHLKCVILPVSYMTIGRRMEQGLERWRIKNYIIYMDLPISSRVPGDHVELLNRRISDNIKLIVDHARTGAHNRTCAANGGVPGKPIREVNMDEDGRLAAKRHTLTVEGTMEANQRDLGSIVASCGARGIKLILINPPAHKSYRIHLEPVQLARSRAVPATMAETNDHVIHLDLLDDDRFTAEDFADTDHLNARGNDKLTAIVREEVQRIISAGTVP